MHDGAGNQALDAVKGVKEDTSKAKELFVRALELAKNGVSGTQDAINVLNNRKREGAKTNETLIELLRTQNAENVQILSEVENAIRQGGLPELLSQ